MGEFDPTMDDIWQIGVDQDRVNETARTMLLARGPYLTTPPLAVTGQHFEARDGRPARTIFRAYGMVQWAGSEPPVHKGDNGDTISAPTMGRISFGFSPEERTYTKDDGTTQLDSASKLWVYLVKAYTKAYGQAPKTTSDIKSYLESSPIKLTIGVMSMPETRNGVFAISAVA